MSMRTLNTYTNEYLAVLAQNGDSRAMETIVERNLNFIYGVAKDIHTKFLEKDDLVQHGCLGLMQAVRKFDASKGFSLLTYAREYVYRAMMNEVEKHESLIRWPKGEDSIVISVDETDEESDYRYTHEAVQLKSEEARPDEVTLTEDVNKRLAAFVSTLTPNEALIFCDKYGFLGHTRKSLSEIAYELGVKELTVQVTFSEANDKFQEAIENGFFRDFAA